jgi:tetratricopeptide (TPR) repeat protein
VLTALIDEQPSAVQYRVMLMHGHFGNDNPEAVVRSLDAAVAWYREHDAWTEAPIAALAEACLETRLMEQSIGLFDEAIALHVKSAPNRGVGDGVLAPYYRKLAGAHAGLGNTDKAVDAAAGAIVSWGRSTHQRGQELAQLEQVLFDSRDLDAYVTRFDRECAENGLENPSVRKALGKVYARKKAFPKAAAQLRLALLAQPNDMETHQMLVTACDGMRRPDLAAEAVLEWARAEGHGLALYRQLGDLWTKLERTDDAERAYTNLVEVSPNESEFQASLAEVRQNQNRWEDALPHWRHVIRIRTNEPAGYFGLARALIRLRHWDEAREIVDEIMAKDWPERFGDVHETGRSLIRDIPRSR